MAMTINGSTGVVYPDGTSQASGQQACKVWVNFNGTGTIAIRGSYNVTSLTDNGTGDYSINFTNALSNANFAAFVCGDIGGASDFVIACTDDRVTARSTTIVRVRIGTSTGSATDSNIVSVSCFN